MKKETKVLLADGIKAVDYQVRDYADGSGRVEVFYFEADGFRHGAVGEKMFIKQADGNLKKESRKQLVKRLCDNLGIAY